MKHVAVLCVALLCGAGAAFAGNRSSITVTEIKPVETPPVTAEAALLETRRIVGSAELEAPPRLVRYQDRAAFGLAPDGTGWLVRGTVTLVSREPFEVNALVDGTTGKLVFAYTDSTGQWPEPMGGGMGADLPRLLREAGWVLGTESPDRMESTMTQVMEQSTHSAGADPTEVGQMIIRPRWNSPRFPARKEGDELVPLRSRAKVWIIEVSGRKTQHPAPPPAEGESPEFYSTEEFFQLKDGSLEFWGRFYRD